MSNIKVVMASIISAVDMPTALSAVIYNREDGEFYSLRHNVDPSEMSSMNYDGEAIIETTIKKAKLDPISIDDVLSRFPGGIDEEIMNIIKSKRRSDKLDNIVD